MRVALYNQMFGLDGRNLFSFAYGHYKVHFQKNFAGRIKSNLDKTASLVYESNSDIAGICEILEDQEEELSEKLSHYGYNYSYYEKGHRTQFRKDAVGVGIFSKHKFNKISIKNFPLKNKMGGGGGAIHCYSPEFNVHFINLHLALLNEDIHNKQLSFIEDYIQKLEGKIVLLGDFNVTYNPLKDRFKSLKLVSEEIKTCPVTFGLKFMIKDIDHIFVKGLEKQKLGAIKGYSDHKLIWADLK
ncbi:MAG: endonuclease/exonuclease/phosphatase family protein [Candidatus Nanoarchaeia archaeon]